MTAAAPSAALPLPVPLPGVGPSCGAALHAVAALPEEQQPNAAGTELGSSPPAAAAAMATEAAAAGAAMELPGGFACSPTLPPPIMVFHSPRQSAGLAASLNRLQLSGGAGEDEPEASHGAPPQPAGPVAAAGAASSGGGGGGGGVASLAHQQPRAELATA